ncbi:tat pathway signal sequence [Colletotrichum sojae]|uniref:Tat pathway signal sequence n=1 Tax=Colletotrichum sojae TaxID=2175907 RepID=A0A8H6IVN4_9PEZI|nr:tat pathway signal sequence [Colletotrichum sojae]
MDQGQRKGETAQRKVKPKVDTKAKPDKISTARALHAQIDLSAIKNVINEDSIPALEKASKQGLGLLHELGPHLRDLASLDANSTAGKDDASRWAEKVDRIISLSRPIPTLIGVVGPTGAGKSSLINGLLGEEQPCLTAEVEFISSSAWAEEIDHLLKDIIGDESAQDGEGEEEKKSAFERVAAVYPKISPQIIPKMSVDDFLTDVDVQRVLGQTVFLKDSSSKGLYKQIQGYIESKAKGNSTTMAHWPLIKVVRVFTKAGALSTGAVLVDLKECSALWIVTPINRAVDDKAANELMGDSFRRQMMFDGLYTAVTVICSKTDDIRVEEAISNLGLSEKLAHDLEQVRSLKNEKRSLETKIPELKGYRGKLRSRIRETDDDADAFDAALERIRNGQTVEQSLSKLGKRKFAAVGEVDVKENEEAFDPNQAGKDYTRISENLPVFCVSSHAYQRMNGQMMVGDFTTAGFRNRLDTGITDLQAHAKALAGSPRAAQCREILSNLIALLSSISYWVTGQDIELAGQDKMSIMQFLKGSADDLDTRLAQSAASCSRKFDRALESELFDKFDDLVEVAVREGIKIAEKCFLPSRLGGLNPNPFRGICNHGGVRIPRSRDGGRSVDLHKELATRLTTEILRSWDLIFNRAVPLVLDQFLRDCTQHLGGFIHVLQQKYITSRPLHAALELLSTEVDEIIDRVSVISVDIKKYITKSQREANRAFVGPIRKAMLPVWAECTKITGEERWDIIFRSSVGMTAQQLRSMGVEFHGMLREGLREIYYTDLMGAVSSTFKSATENRKLSDEEIRLREAVTAILLTIPDRFNQD